MHKLYNLLPQLQCTSIHLLQCTCESAVAVATVSSNVTKKHLCVCVCVSMCLRECEVCV